MVYFSITPSSEFQVKFLLAIKGKNNRTTELYFKIFLVRNSIKGFKTNVKDLPGKPDFYFPNGRIAIFIDGCFWHGCPQCGHIPKTRSDFWLTKFNRNRERDQRNNATLKSMRINPVRIWEHELKDLNGLNHILSILS